MRERCRMRVGVVVLGDLGRSPRMGYHALSLANQGLPYKPDSEAVFESYLQGMSTLVDQYRAAGISPVVDNFMHAPGLGLKPRSGRSAPGRVPLNRPCPRIGAGTSSAF